MDIINTRRGDLVTRKHDGLELVVLYVHADPQNTVCCMQTGDSRFETAVNIVDLGRPEIKAGSWVRSLQAAKRSQKAGRVRWRVCDVQTETHVQCGQVRVQTYYKFDAVLDEAGYHVQSPPHGLDPNHTFVATEEPEVVTKLKYEKKTYDKAGDYKLRDLIVWGGKNYPVVPASPGLLYVHGEPYDHGEPLVHFNWSHTHRNTAGNVVSKTRRPEVKEGMWVRDPECPTGKLYRVSLIEPNGAIRFDRVHSDEQTVCHSGLRASRTWIPVLDPGEEVPTEAVYEERLRLAKEEEERRELPFRKGDLVEVAGWGPDPFVVTDEGMGKPRDNIMVKAHNGVKVLKVCESHLRRPAFKAGMWVRDVTNPRMLCRIDVLAKKDAGFAFHFDQRVVDDYLLFGNWTGKRSAWIPVAPPETALMSEKGQLVGVKGDVDPREEEIAGLRADVQTLREMRTRAKAEHEANVKTLEQRLEGQKCVVRRVAEERYIAQERVRQLEGEVDRLHIRAGSADRLAEERLTEIKRLRTELAHARRLYDEHDQRLAESRKLRQHHEEQAKRSDALIEDLLQERRERLREIEGMRAEIQNHMKHRCPEPPETTKPSILM